MKTENWIKLLSMAFFAGFLVAAIFFYFGGRIEEIDGGLIKVKMPDNTSTTPPTISTPYAAESGGDFIRSTCDWARDWELQSDGSYRWIGLPPGTSGCQNIGQSGELFNRLTKGEEITLVVEVGETPLGLDICGGSYKATEIIPGQTCASGIPDVWPKVSGTLVVVGSTGFLVGTGK